MNKPLNYIANSWVAPDRTLPAQLCDSNTGAVLASQMGSSGKQVELALQAAATAYQNDSWMQLSATARAARLELIADGLEQRRAAIAHTDAIQTGVVLASTEKVAMICAAAFRGAALLLRD